MFTKLIDKAFSLIDLPQGKFKHFSFIMRRNKVLAVGWNLMNKTHPWTVKYGYEYEYQHSELMALVRFPKPLNELTRCSLINIRIGNSGKILLSRPCKHCSKLIQCFKIGETYYSNEFGNFEQLIY